MKVTEDKGAELAAAVQQRPKGASKGVAGAGKPDRGTAQSVQDTSSQRDRQEASEEEEEVFFGRVSTPEKARSRKLKDRRRTVIHNSRVSVCAGMHSAAGQGWVGPAAVLCPHLTQTVPPSATHCAENSTPRPQT